MTNDKYFVFAKFKARGSNTFETFECYCNATSPEKALQIAKVRYNTELGRTPDSFVEAGAFKIYIKNRKDWFLIKQKDVSPRDSKVDEIIPDEETEAKKERPKKTNESAWSIMQKIYNKNK